MKEQNTLLSEDWLVNLLGLLSIFLLMFGLQLPTPADDWGNADELLNSVLSLENLGKFALQFAMPTASLYWALR